MICFLFNLPIFSTPVQAPDRYRLATFHLLFNCEAWREPIQK
jgi:hypothetical protein